MGDRAGGALNVRSAVGLRAMLRRAVLPPTSNLTRPRAPSGTSCSAAGCMAFKTADEARCSSQTTHQLSPTLSVLHMNAPTRFVATRSTPSTALLVRLCPSGMLLLVPPDRSLQEFHETSEACLSACRSRMRVEVGSQQEISPTAQQVRALLRREHQTPSKRSVVRSVPHCAVGLRQRRLAAVEMRR